jgi:hypothetical protein
MAYKTIAYPDAGSLKAGLAAEQEGGFVPVSHSAYTEYDPERHVSNSRFHVLYTDAPADAAGQGESLSAVHDKLDGLSASLKGSVEGILAHVDEWLESRFVVKPDAPAAEAAPDTSQAPTADPAAQIAETDKLAAAAKGANGKSAPPTDAKPAAETAEAGTEQAPAAEAAPNAGS